MEETSFVCVVILLWLAFAQPPVSYASPTYESYEGEDLIDLLRRILNSETRHDTKERNSDAELEGKAGFQNEVVTNHNPKENQREIGNQDDGPKPYKKKKSGSSVPEILQTRNGKRDEMSTHNGGARIKELLKEVMDGDVDPDNLDLVDILRSEVHSDGDGQIRNSFSDGDIIRQIEAHSSRMLAEGRDKHEIRYPYTNIDSKENIGRITKRNFRKDRFGIWPKGIIPYEINGERLQAQENTALIENAMEELKNLTCVRFVKRNSPEASEVDSQFYINIFGDFNGYVFDICYACLGRNYGGQPVGLGKNCLNRPTILHELMHAMGQYHEQSRWDRDNHITILWNNIDMYDGNRNFDIHKTQDNNPYDYESVLQYRLTALSKNVSARLPSMELHDRRLEFLLDLRQGLSFYDVQDILDAYQCTDHCTDPPQCQNSGVVNHKCQCYCPKGITGSFCEKTESDSVCGKDIIDLTDGIPQTILSPKTPAGDAYPVNVKCVFVIKAPLKRRIKLTINELDLPYTELISRNGEILKGCDHWLEVQYNLIGQSGPRECGTIINKTFRTTGNGPPNMMMMKFDSRYAADIPAKKGFNLTVETIGLGCTTKPCHFGTCSEDSIGDYTCACQPTWTGIHCDIPSASTTFLCTFEDNTKCIMDNVDDDQNDWERQPLKRFYDHTGPDYPQEGTYFLFMRAGFQIYEGFSARFETTYWLLAVDRCLTFWYYMYGRTIRTLTVYTTSTLRSTRQILWSMSGNQGKEWHVANVFIPAEDGQKIGFEGQRGRNLSSEIALDSIELRPGKCSQTQSGEPVKSTETQTTTPNIPETTSSPTTRREVTTNHPTTKRTTPQFTTTQKPMSTNEPDPSERNILLHCSFEPGDEDCSLKNVTYDDFDWSLHQGQTSTPNTGPTEAVQGLYYTYIETSRRRKTRYDVAVLESGILPKSQHYIMSRALLWKDRGVLIVEHTWKDTDMCLQFYYHIYGAKIGNLTLKIKTVDVDPYEAWAETGDHGNAWNHVQVDLRQLSEEFVILFSASQGLSRAGDIALDDIKIHEGLCVPLTLPATCSFEPGEECFLRNYAYDFYWMTHTGSTKVKGTGPSSAVEEKYYKYIQSSRISRGAQAWLGSNQLPAGTAMCLQFQYHMYGNGIGNLSVVHDVDGLFHRLWSWDNSNGDQWYQIGVDIPAYDMTSLIFFVAVRGKSPRGEIAIDDVHIFEGSCPRRTNSSIHCSFSPDELPCFLGNVDDDDEFDWSFSNKITGPSALHMGHYAYINSKSRKNGDKAILSSAHTSIPEGHLCLEFWYNMYGRNVDTLMVNSGMFEHEEERWVMTRNPEDVWKHARVNIPAVDYDQTISITGRVGGRRGDIAIDEVWLTPGYC